MDVFEKIRAQQPAQRTAVWMVGEQLANIIRHDPAAQEIVSRDLDGLVEVFVAHWATCLISNGTGCCAAWG